MRLVVVIVLVFGIAACSTDPITSADSCADLERAWLESLADPNLTGDELNEVQERAMDRLSMLIEEAEELSNPIQQEACSTLLVDMAFTGGALDPTFETCPDGSLAVIGECE